MLHSFQLNGYNIVMDVNSGAVHVVDPLTYRLLSLLGEDREALPATKWYMI